MTIKKEACKFHELEITLSQYIEEKDIKKFISLADGFQSGNEYLYSKSYMPEIPFGTLGWISPQQKYYINMRISTLWILCIILDISITKGIATAAGTATGKLKQTIFELDEVSAEKCLLLEIVKGNIKKIEMNHECFNNHFKCCYRSNNYCAISRSNIEKILYKLESKGIIVKRDGTYKCNF